MNNDLISIIIPVYNAEKYLEKCLNSVINQTYKNLEIILIDDGSTDKSGKICNKYAKKDKRINVYHKKNSGVSDTRNYGIKKSNGDYLTFLDSDDWIDIELIDNLYKEMIVNNSDFVQGNLKLVINGKIIENKMKNFFTNDINDLKLGILNLFYKEEYKNLRCVCGKLFKSNIIKINNIMFDNKIYLLEDGIFVYKYLNYSKKISFINNGVYFYNQLITSSSHRYNKDQLEQYKAVYNKFSDLCSDDNNIFLNYTILEFLMTYISRSSKFYKNRNKFITELKKVLSDEIYINCINNLGRLKLKLKQKVTYILLKNKLYTALYMICILKEVKLIK